MTLQQTAQATRRYRKACPVTRRHVCRLVKDAGPLLVLSLISVAEIPLLKNVMRWIEGNQPYSAARILLEIGGLWIGLTLWLTFLIWIINRFSKPTLESDGDGFRLLNRRGQVVPWRQLSRVILEPVSPDESLVKVWLHGRLDSQGKPLFKPWIIILEKDTQLEPWLRELRDRHLATPTFTVRALREPIPPRDDSGTNRRSAYVFLLGAWLFLHGLPLVVVGLSKSETELHRPRSVGPPPEAFAHFILEHFNSVKQFRRFLVDIGAGLSIAGVACLAVGSRGMKLQEEKAALEARNERARIEAAPGINLLTEA
ncbi:MAG: hypothetical protein JNN07_21185 [Verrucomicrobiales bacterium]|nr:hypothetical protein [Verrucomicrobiales bacterium]